MEDTTKLTNEEIFKLLYSQGRDLRFTQDSPVLPDVWAAYAENPDRPVDLLLTPFQEQGSTPLSPAKLAAELDKRLSEASAQSKVFHRTDDTDGGEEHTSKHQIAVNQTTVAVRLWFDELVRVILPLSSWWQSSLIRAKADPELRAKALGALEEMRTAAGRRRMADIFARNSEGHPPEVSADLYWTILVVGTIALANQATKRRKGKRAELPLWPIPCEMAPRKKCFQRLFDTLAELFAGAKLEELRPPLIHLVSRNRPAMTCIYRSVPAVKADAAVRLFKIDCSDITWAVADSGIDARHPAFRHRDVEGKLKPLNKKGSWAEATRVVATYDFTIIRQILSTADADVASLPERLKRMLKRDPERRKEIRARLLAGREIDWQLLEPYIRVPHDEDYDAPLHDHGTHVAGIIGADWRTEEDEEGRLDLPLIGMCPTIHLIDLRILDANGLGDEFSVMAALQYLRYLNSHKDYMVVHGANLSLSIRHEVKNYACGRTPICEECQRLVASGLVVVAAAGNEGFARGEQFATGREYQSISITDPGNSADVITVGATHRDMPHTYGVSYFSSRGPTGDGRIKPDLVAPGEKIDSVSPNNGLVRKDGTSMAAPHVSGAAALLIARHREFLGRPDRVKAVLCESATDLGRERHFQGCGMLDVLRALQSV